MNLGMASCCATFRFRPQFLSETLGLSPIYLNKSLSCSSFSHTTHYSSSISLNPSINLPNNLVCKAAGYVFPDPIPEFADSETRKFSRDLIDKLTRKKKDLFGDSMEEVVGICTEIMSNFLHTEYGGPGTLLVIPFIDMADTINERGLPGGPQAARAAVVWAQKHVDKDWKAWIKGENNDDSK